jgi:adenosylcobinamide-GDP ribazoletransferase
MKSLLTAIQFLTIFGPGKKAGVTSDNLSRSLLYFPFVGLLIGGCLVVANFILSNHLSNSIVNISIILLLIILTGALHLDGFADTIDGFYAGKDRQEILKIMEDSRIGTMGATGLIILILSKFALLEGIPEVIKYKALLLMPVSSRWAMVVSGSLSKPAKSEGLGKFFCKPVGLRGWLGGTLFTLIVAFLILKIRSILFIVSLFLLTLILTGYINRKIGGMTGDTFGAINELSEVFSLLIFSLM